MKTSVMFIYIHHLYWMPRKKINGAVKLCEQDPKNLIRPFGIFQWNQSSERVLIKTQFFPDYMFRFLAMKPVPLQQVLNANSISRFLGIFRFFRVKSKSLNELAFPKAHQILIGLAPQAMPVWWWWWVPCECAGNGQQRAEAESLWRDNWTNTGQPPYPLCTECHVPPFTILSNSDSLPSTLDLPQGSGGPVLADVNLGRVAADATRDAAARSAQCVATSEVWEITCQLCMIEWL